MTDNFTQRFTLSGGCNTKDGYRLDINGHIISKASMEKSSINSVILMPVSSYFHSKLLFEVLEIVENQVYGELSKSVAEEFKKKGMSIIEFQISTVDAKFNDLSIDIDPNLEKRSKKKKGLFGRLLGKN